MPDVVKKVFEEKHGFANFYFNRREQERVLKLWKPPGDAKNSRGPWTFIGSLQSGKEVSLRVTDSAVELKAPAGASKWILGPKFADDFQGGSNDGLLAAIFLYRLMAVDGPKAFTDVYYSGTYPLATYEGLFDVVVAGYRGAESWFYFDSHGRLTAMEIYADEHLDPWEVHFTQYRDIDAHDLPGRIAVQSPAGAVFQIDFDRFRFTDEASK